MMRGIVRFTRLRRRGHFGKATYYGEIVGMAVIFTGPAHLIISGFDSGEIIRDRSFPV